MSYILQYLFFCVIIFVSNVMLLIKMPLEKKQVEDVEPIGILLL